MKQKIGFLILSGFVFSFVNIVSFNEVCVPSREFTNSMREAEKNKNRRPLNSLCRKYSGGSFYHGKAGEGCLIENKNGLRIKCADITVRDFKKLEEDRDRAIISSKDNKAASSSDQSMEAMQRREIQLLDQLIALQQLELKERREFSQQVKQGLEEYKKLNQEACELEKNVKNS